MFKFIVVQCFIYPTKCLSSNFCNAIINLLHMSFYNNKNLHIPIVFIVQFVTYFSFINTGKLFSKDNIFPFYVTVLFFILLRLIIDV